MAIKDKQDTEIMSVYDPAQDAYHEVEISKVKKQLTSLGLTEEEADARVKALKESK